MTAVAESCETIAPPLPVRDTLFELELRVARRADELSCGHESSRGRDLLVWFEAEKEIFSLLPS
jgi:hypothetical protein